MNNHKYDYLIVGAGLYGAAFARLMHDAGKKVKVIDKRPHIAGNCYTQEVNGIHVHKYGAHIMHTSKKKVWDFILQYTEMNHYTNRVRVRFEDKLYSFPINMNTLNQLYGVLTPEEAKEKLASVKIPNSNPQNLEEYILSIVGPEIYETFIKGYTQKQWGKSPKELPASIIKRLPIRFTYDDNYFNDCYQGIPKNGYTQFFEKLLSGIELELNIDFLENKSEVESLARKIIYCGKIDEFFDYKFGELEWRSLRFDIQELEVNDFQGTAVVNYTAEDVPFTRILEHKHFDQVGVLPEMGHTVITKEYPEEWDRAKEAYYPVRDSMGRSELYEKYKSEAEKIKNVVFRGRLAEYIYRDMCPTIDAAMMFAKYELSKS